MYSIAICDDERLFSDFLKEICAETFAELEIPCKIDVFHSGKDLLRCLTETSRTYNLLLLDILMEELNGIALAEKIRENDAETAIVFISASPDFALHGYRVHAWQYILKPVDAALLKDLLRTLYREKAALKQIALSTGSGKTRIALEEILYLETSGRKVAVCLREKRVLTTLKLGELLERLDSKHLVRCHQSFALNIKHVRELKKTSAILSDGRVVPVSRAYEKNTQKTFLQSLGER